MEIYYCDKWSTVKKKPWNRLEESAAMIRHNNRQDYTAILCEGGMPRHLVNVTDQWVSVSFLDEQLRAYLHYDFIVKEDKLFLKTAMYWEYEGATDTETKRMIVGYHENGRIAMEQSDFVKGEREERETQDDVSRNWDTYPAFGEYLHLCREER